MDSSNQTNEEVEELDWTPDQEVMLLYSLDGLKPVGQHKHFRMLGIQDRLSNAMNKKISTKAIWNKLNTLYDLETLDEAEAEADSAVAVVSEFSLPEDEFGELIALKLKGVTMKEEPCNMESGEIQHSDEVSKIALKSLKSGQSLKTSKEIFVGELKKNVEEDKENTKESTETKKISPPKNKAKEAHKNISSNQKETSKAENKLCLKEVDKKESNENINKEDKSDFNNDDKTECLTKGRNKETAKLKSRGAVSVEAVKEDANLKKRKCSQDTNGAKSPKKIPETGAKLRTKEKKQTESEKSGTSVAGKKRELSRHSMSKVSDLHIEELQVKKVRSTRNSLGLGLPQEKRQTRFS